MLKLAKDFATKNPVIQEIIVNGRYVDDIVESGSNEKEMLNIAKEIDNCLEKGGFLIKKWNSNKLSIDKSRKESCSVLGYTWNKKEDTFTIIKRTKSLKKLLITAVWLYCITLESSRIYGSYFYQGKNTFYKNCGRKV